MKYDPLVIAAIQLLTELLQKTCSGTLLSEGEGELGEAIIEVLPPSVTLFCVKCAERDVSHQAIEGFTLCRTHTLEWFREESPIPGRSPSQILAPKTQADTDGEELAFVETVLKQKRMEKPVPVADAEGLRFVEELLAQKRLGRPASVDDMARAHLVVDGRSYSQEELCSECEREGHPWPACEGFSGLSLCCEHLHEAISARVTMT